MLDGKSGFDSDAHKKSAILVVFSPETMKQLEIHNKSVACRIVLIVVCSAYTHNISYQNKQ